MFGNGPVDQGLGVAAVHQRFTHEDLVSIVTTNIQRRTGHPYGHRQDRWLSQGTGALASFGTTAISGNDAAAEANASMEGASNEREPIATATRIQPSRQ